MLVTGQSSFYHNGSISYLSHTSTMGNSSAVSVPEGCVMKTPFLFIPWDNEDNIVTKEFENVIKLLLIGICLPLVFIVSFFTNMVNMVVFYQHGLKERINACLFTLSLVDLLSVTSMFGYNCDVPYMFFIGQGGQLGPITQFFSRNYLVGLYGLVTSSQIVYCVISLERCLCVTRPLLAKNLLPTKTTVVVLWVMTFVITGGSLFVGGIRYGVMCVFDPNDGSISYASYPSDFYFRHKFVMDVMYSLLYGLFFPGFSFSFVTICTIVTAIKLKKLSQWRETVSSASGAVNSKDLAIARVIAGTSVLFIVCIVPSIVQRSSFLVVPELRVGGRYDNLAWVIRRFNLLASALNNTFNFFIYYAFGSRFRETTRRLFPLCFRDGSVNGENQTLKSVEKI